MKKKYSDIYNSIIALINKYQYQNFVGPLNEDNFNQLIETLPQNNCLNQSYSLLTKDDMETRVNYLEIRKNKKSSYTIHTKDTNNKNYLFILFHWEEQNKVISILYNGLTTEQKIYFYQVLLNNHIYFDSLSKELILLGFNPNKNYTMNDDIEDE